MKKFLSVLAMTVIFSQTASAAFIEKNVRHFHIPSGKVVELYKVNEEAKTAVYWDYDLEKRVVVNLEDVSQEVDHDINGVKAGKFVLANIDGNAKACQVYYVFENGMSRIGCQSGKMTINIGVDRPQVLQYNDNVEDLSAEIKSMSDFTKGEKARLKVFVGNLRVGTKVRIEAIFPNGEALIQKMDVGSFIDTSSLLLKHNIERVQLADLAKIK